MNLSTRRYLKIPKIDGVHVRVPVSDFVLNLSKQPSRLGTAIRRRSIAEQSAALALTVVLCASSFGMTYANPHTTLSYFRDDEISRTNLFAAGLLGFRLNPGDVTVPIQEGDLVMLSPLFAPLPNTFDIQYRVRAEIVGSDSPLCSLLVASGTSSPYVYEGALKDLVTAPATTTGHGHLEVRLPNAAGVANGTTCTVALAYSGWFVGAPENTGYTDKHRDTFTFVYNSASQPPVPQAAAIAETNTETVIEEPVTASSTEETELPPTDMPTEVPQTETPPTEASVPETVAPVTEPPPSESAPVTEEPAVDPAPVESAPPETGAQTP